MPKITTPEAKERHTVMVDRILQRIRALDTTPTQVGKKAGLARGWIGDFLRGDITNPGEDKLEQLAGALDVDVAFLKGRQNSLRLKHSAGLQDPTTTIDSTIPIVGGVNAGMFTEMSGPEPWLSDADFDKIAADRNRSYSRARCFAFRVVGDSMNNSKPYPILDGQVVLCVDVIDAEIGVVDNQIYVVRRTRDSGQTYEWTVKRARVFRDRYELIPESTNPSYKPLIIWFGQNSRFPDTGEEIVVVGLVYSLQATIGDFP